MHTIRRFAAPAGALVLAFTAPAGAQDVHPAAGGLAVQIAPHAYVVTEAGRNLVLITGARESMAVGLQTPALVAKARQVLATLHAPPVRYAVMMMGPGAPGFEDAGWERGGALAIAQERLRRRIFGAAENRPATDTSGRHAPSMGFSEVVQIAMGEDEDAHLVHQPAGATDADVAVHFEGASVLYLSSLTTDGYPDLNADDGGTVGGLIKTVDAFANNFADAPQAVEPIVPSRGPLAQLDELREFRDMLIAVRDAINPLLQAGKTADEVVAAHPTAQLDARWGHGPVSPDQFVRAACAALAKERAAPARP